MMDPQPAAFLAVGVVGLIACAIGLIWYHFHYRRHGYVCYMCGYYSKSQHHLTRVQSGECPTI